MAKVKFCLLLRLCFSLFSVCLLVGGLSAPSSLVFSLFLVKGLKKVYPVKSFWTFETFKSSISFFEYACTFQFSRHIEFGSTCILGLFQTTTSNFIPLYITGVNKGQFNMNVGFQSSTVTPKSDGLRPRPMCTRQSPMVDVICQSPMVHQKARNCA